MKATGIVRRFDENGRFVLPMELRRQFGLDGANDALEIFVDDDNIILRKYQTACVFCGTSEDTVQLHEKKVCRKCAEKIGMLFAD